MTKVTSFGFLFFECNGHPSHDLNCWNTSQVVNMHLVFAEGNFSGFVSKWDTGKVTSLNGAFGRSTVFRGEELLHWNTGNVQDMFGAFSNMLQIGILATENWNVSKVYTFDSAFRNTDFRGDLGNWDASSAVLTRFVFAGCGNFNGDIGRWNMSRVEWTDCMLAGCHSFNQARPFMLRKICRKATNSTAGSRSVASACVAWKITFARLMHLFFLVRLQDMSGWDVSKLQIANAMFANAR